MNVSGENGIGGKIDPQDLLDMRMDCEAVEMMREKGFEFMGLVRSLLTSAFYWPIPPNQRALKRGETLETSYFTLHSLCPLVIRPQLPFTLFSPRINVHADISNIQSIFHNFSSIITFHSAILYY